MYVNKKTVALKELICAVRLVNTKAARYLNGTEVTKLESFSMPDFVTKPSRHLESIFLWRESKQGHSFWDGVCRQLIEADREREREAISNN